MWFFGSLKVEVQIPCKCYGNSWFGVCSRVVSHVPLTLDEKGFKSHQSKPAIEGYLKSCYCSEGYLKSFLALRVTSKVFGSEGCLKSFLALRATSTAFWL